MDEFAGRSQESRVRHEMTRANPYERYIPRTFAWDIGFPEGPTLLSDGSLCVSEMRSQRITRLFPDGTRKVVEELSGTPNGTAVDARGRIYYCETRRRDWVVRPYPYAWPGAPEMDLPVPHTNATNEPRIGRKDAIGLAGQAWSGATADGAEISQPSDITVDPLGNAYFTDGGSSRPGSTGMVWFKPGTGGPAEILVAPLSYPNGIALSPDNDILYVTETRTGRLWAFSLDAPGLVSDRECIMVFASGGPFNVGGADGLTVAANGLVLVACLGRGDVSIVDPREREVIGVLDCGDELLVTNVIVDDCNEYIYVTLGTTGAVLQWSKG